MVWDFKGEEGNSLGDDKANIWQTHVCCSTQKQWDLESPLISMFPPTTPSPYSLQTSQVITLFA